MSPPSVGKRHMPVPCIPCRVVFPSVQEQLEYFIWAIALITPTPLKNGNLRSTYNQLSLANPDYGPENMVHCFYGLECLFPFKYVSPLSDIGPSKDKDMWALHWHFKSLLHC